MYVCVSICVCVVTASRKQQNVGGRGAIAILEPAKYLATGDTALTVYVFSRPSSSHPAISFVLPTSVLFFLSLTFSLFPG